jgi:hypothetical protein
MAPCGAIVERIERTPARTIAGLHVKARALVWCQAEEADIGPDMFNFTLGDTTTDLRLGASIVCDLLAIAEART